ncbi:hypothetical protein A4H97_15765 [Niastella yeongjuensis]|uniref:Lipoprotein n=1 Tax=Niastella yeongjuensis TaxID=354355 RepID=A0A1V9E4J9_9BACT|nr:hypothetical protein [Niastella yeongjuensis]OQP41053.1 hypothetical protein A4H97_15765 [Niastella yeongjuensis]SEO93640.1 hypothetical protein SAMN05660816_03898 [Niastella yeongjuensis]
MQKRRSIFFGLMACCLVTTTFYACKKEAKDAKDAATDITAANDNTMAESNYNDATNMVDLSAAAGTNFTFRTETGPGVARIEEVLGTCATVSVDTVVRKITIDFGAADCVGPDLRKRRGKIIATWTGSYRAAGTVINISFDNYFVNNNQVKGTHKTTNMGFNQAGNLVYKIEVDGSIVKANGGTITWKSTREREWTAGISTPLNPLDDVYSITGSASGTTAAGAAYNISITQPLIKKMNCYWFDSGKVTLTPAGGSTWTLDYGTTGCDAKATVSVGALSYDIVLF